MRNIEFVSTPLAPTPGGHYSQAALCDGWLYVSGQLPLLANGSHAAEADFDTQCERALTNMFRILEAAGSAPNQVVKVTAYIVGVDRWPAFNRTYARMFGTHRPARSVVPVPELHYGYLIEVDAVAVVTTR